RAGPAPRWLRTRATSRTAKVRSSSSPSRPRAEPPRRTRARVRWPRNGLSPTGSPIPAVAATTAAASPSSPATGSMTTPRPSRPTRGPMRASAAGSTARSRAATTGAGSSTSPRKRSVTCHCSRVVQRTPGRAGRRRRATASSTVSGGVTATNRRTTAVSQSRPGPGRTRDPASPTSSSAHEGRQNRRTAPGRPLHRRSGVPHPHIPTRGTPEQGDHAGTEDRARSSRRPPTAGGDWRRHPAPRHAPGMPMGREERGADGPPAGDGPRRARWRALLATPRRRRVAAGIPAVAVLATAAAVVAVPGEEDAAPEPTTTTTTTTTTPPTTQPPPVYPLTGLPVTDPAVAARPTLAVKIDNVEPRSRPQYGLNQADVVYEERVEGAVTRFLALFHSHDAMAVGPVRSARTTDIGLYQPMGTPLFAWSGANAHFARRVRETRIVDIGYDAQPGLYSRVGDRPAPHNLMLHATSDVWARDWPG